MQASCGLRSLYLREFEAAGRVVFPLDLFHFTQTRTSSCFAQVLRGLAAENAVVLTARLRGERSRSRKRVEEFTDYDSVVVFSDVGRAYIAKFFVTSH